MDEVYAPDMVPISGAQPDDRAVLVIETLPARRGLFHLEAVEAEAMAAVGEPGGGQVDG